MIKRLPWLRNLKKTDAEPPLRLPIACGPISNGEGWWPDSRRKKLIRKLVSEKAEQVSRREGIDRREFMASACGMATTLYMINLVNGCSDGKDPLADNGVPATAGTGGDTTSAPDAGTASGSPGFNVPDAAMEDPAIASCALGDDGDELIIDMQSHFATPETNQLGAAALAGFIGDINNARFPWIVRTPGCESISLGAGCYDRTEYVQQILMGSDTTIGVLSGISYSVGAAGTGTSGFAALSNEDLMTGAQWLQQNFPGRVLTHCMVMPNDRLEMQLAMMERNADSYTNWKTYPPWSPRDNQGYWLDSNDSGEGGGPQMLQKGIELGAHIFCIHKGFPLSSFSPTYTDPRDVGGAARMFPDARLVIYHSAFEHGLGPGESTEPSGADVGWGPGKGNWPEGPYDDNDPMVQMRYPLDRGVNSLIKSLRDNNIGPNGRDLDDPNGPVRTHVYAETGGVWCALMTNRAEEAMHYWGKLLLHFGEDRIVWGTDCLWFGSPQPVIQAFRAFEISQELQDSHGYPALTPAIKAKILGGNAARLQNERGANIQGCHSDIVGAQAARLKRELDEEFGTRRDMMFAIQAPRSRREFLNLRAAEHQEKLHYSGRVPPA